MNAGDPGPELNLGLLCFIAYRAMETRVMDAVLAAGFDDVTIAQARMFARIGPDGTRLTDLAEQAQVTKQTAGFLVNQLERGGYVQREPHPGDGRPAGPHHAQGSGGGGGGPRGGGRGRGRVDPPPGQERYRAATARTHPAAGDR